MTILFISDLHLDAERPDITQNFLKFLDGWASQAKALYILGDLFEVWVGDDGMDGCQRQIARALHELTSAGTKVFIVHGNRDFMLGKAFCKQTGCTLLQEETLIQLHGKSVLLMHGDTLCTEDVVYQRKRWRFRNPVSRWLLRNLPLSTRLNLARKLRKASRNHTQQQSSIITDVTQKAVERVMLKHQVTTLIHGHTHRPAIHSFQLQGQEAHRIVLGDWDKGISFLLVDDQGNYQLQPTPL